ncbi:BLUF domain-containing protein [Psychrobacter aquimaris]|jgi:hypothetical protein|uniref:BLUF domain-containing protein n=1 Tax=Psychrobacter aquimaris TaxID=292733 RepID=UPI003FD2C21A
MQNKTNCISMTNKDGENALISLTYIGNNKGKDDGIELIRTLEKWRVSNKETDVTSALAINDTYFIQNLEGSRLIINEVLATLTKEYPRILLHVVEVKEIESRRWNGFLIKYLTSNDQDTENTLKSFLAGTEFNPYLMRQTQITSLIKALFEERKVNSTSN